MPTEFNDENLVAFLDGELPDEEAAAIKDAASENSELKHRISQLQASWELLGEIPAVQPSPQLAQSTIEMVTLAIAKDTRTWGQWIGENRWVLLAGLLSICLFSGWGMGRFASAQADRQMIEDLHLFADSIALKYIGDEDTLRRISRIENLVDSVAPDEINLAPKLIVNMSDSERRNWLKTLDPFQRDALADRKAAFDEMKIDSPEQIEKMRKLGDFIAREKNDAVLLLRAAKAYGNLIDSVGDAGKYRIEQASTEEEQSFAISEELAWSYLPSARDRNAIGDWASNVSNDMLVESAGLYSPQLTTEMLISIHMTDFDNNESRNLVSATGLDGRARKLLEALEFDSQREIILTWVSLALEEPVSEGDLSQSDTELLMSKFRDLSVQKQEPLLLLPPREVRKALSGVN